MKGQLIFAIFTMPRKLLEKRIYVRKNSERNLDTYGSNTGCPTFLISQICPDFEAPNLIKSDFSPPNLIFLTRIWNNDSTFIGDFTNIPPTFTMISIVTKCIICLFTPQKCSKRSSLLKNMILKKLLE